MGFKSFINSVEEKFGIESGKAKSKKRELKNILKLLSKRREKLEKKSGKKRSKEDIKLISLQIKKCEKILEKLNS